MSFRLENERLRVEVNSMGAELWSVYDKKSSRELLWQGDGSIWPRRSPTLFPVCGKMRNGPLPLHGFIRDYEHRLEQSSGCELSFRCEQNEETLAMYPHRFTFDTIYTLKDDTLHCTFRIANPSAEALPFSVGFHTGFFAADDSVLRFEQPEHCDRLNCDNDGFVCGRTADYFAGGCELPLTGEHFPSTVLLDHPKSQYAQLLTGGIPVLRFGFQGFPYLAIWVKELPVKFVCIEPWHGLPDGPVAAASLDEKAGIVQLPPEKTFCCEQTITAL